MHHFRIVKCYCNLCDTVQGRRKLGAWAPLIFLTMHTDTSFSNLSVIPSAENILILSTTAPQLDCSKRLQQVLAWKISATHLIKSDF